MLITEMLVFSDEYANASGHSIMLKVASWGKEYYIDLEQYCNMVNNDTTINKFINNISSNILEIGRTQK